MDGECERRMKKDGECGKRAKKDGECRKWTAKGDDAGDERLVWEKGEEGR